MPILVCAMHAEEGILRSGVAVETIIKSMSFGSSPAEAIASNPARAARSDLYSSGSAMCRSRIPNLSTTHCGEVCRFATTCSLVRILDGTYEPVDLMQTLSKWLFPFLISPLQSREQNEIAQVNSHQGRLYGQPTCLRRVDRAQTYGVRVGYYRLPWLTAFPCTKSQCCVILTGGQHPEGCL